MKMHYLFFILLSACAMGEWPDVERGTDELHARDIVWTFFGATQEAPPSVHWEEGEACPTIPGRHILRYLDNGTIKCLLGWYWEPDHHARVIRTDKISDSAYAHELYHAWLWIHTGDLDPNHRNPGWTTVVGHANDLLRQSNL